MPNLSWKDAIIRVLETATDPMHYVDIAEAVSEQELRTELGATPAQTVNATISVSIQSDGDDSPFLRVARSLYALRDRSMTQSMDTDSSSEVLSTQANEESDGTGLINAFGMYWARSGVRWTSKPLILGQATVSSTKVDFCDQRGVYLLHDGRSVVYVGRAIEQPLGVRLKQHVSDRLNGRWDRFSWFGVYEVAEDAQLLHNGDARYGVDMLIITMEALLIEGLEPPQNRKSGDGFRAREFLQVEDPEIHKDRIRQLMSELEKQL
ncbi:MAG: winged helix-turn-helix domain-containing protein [Candidatus Poribacteria bacterium]|nr:winged helix-turn-helix domain-containing protein [Candidatus Poribacteria bacterium]